MNGTNQSILANTPSSEQAIAIIGMSGRFPEAINCDQFWENLCKGKESISRFSLEESRAAGILENLLQSPQYINARGVIADAGLFDADFFGMSSAEAQITDPQHRLFLECAWESLENAGYCSNQYEGSIGVYGGCGTNFYYLNYIHGNQNIERTFGRYLIHLGNEKDYLATRTSYKLDLKGPSLTVQTACSTSLVAVSLACNHLLSYQCDMALAGGATITIPQESGYLYQQDMILSPDGHCRPFDGDAKGTVPGNGVGIVVLKRMEDALADRDHIYAVIRGYGVNNDGMAKVGYTAVSPQGQSDAIASALAMAELDPETIQYVETHGTATFLGDPIEINALTQAFRYYTQKKQFCAIGSVKSNIGHLFETAGVAGLIKAALMIYHGKIPPSLHFNRPNPYIDFANSPFFVNPVFQEWKRENGPRRAGVSSFGFGGTNVHVILEEAPGLLSTQTDKKEYLIILSAKTSTALKAMSKNLGNYLKTHPDISLEDVAYTLQVGRKAFAHRRAIICESIESAIGQLLEDMPIINEIADPELESMMKAWIAGGVVNWVKLYSRSCPRRTPLPTYPFEKKHFWIQSAHVDKTQNSQTIGNTLPEIEAALLIIWKEFFGLESMNLQDDFFRLGGDSLLASQIIVEIQSRLHISLKMHVLFEFSTVSLLAQHIMQKFVPENASIPSILVQLKTGGDRKPLFFVHPIGGHVFCYKSLIENIKYEGPIFGIQAPVFVENPAESLKSVEEIASYYVRAIKNVQPSGSYHLLGASFGGIVAYEMARQLQEEKLSVGLLTMLDAGRMDVLFTDIRDETQMLGFLVELFESKPIDFDNFSSLSRGEQLKRLRKSLGLEQLDATLQDQIFSQITMSLNALMHYRPKPYSGKVLFFQAEEKFFRFPELSLWTTWKDLVLGGIDYHEIAGNHLNILSSPGVMSIQKILNSILQN
jgi:3-oxoacyl-(acyl-carrier-protein) synthase/thioesterase domain-containing protein/acyl carrier protein